jgi:putative ABC transport system permease protein
MKLRRLWQNLFEKQRVERDLDDETSAYLEGLVEEKIRRGVSAAEARRQARLEMGGVEQVKESVRDVRTGILLDTLWQDLRFAARVLRKAPGFTLAAVFVLALGIGANTAIFSLVYGVLYRPLPYPGADRVAVVYMHFVPQNNPRGNLSPADYFDWKARNHAFEDVAVFGSRKFDLTADGGSDQVAGSGTTAAFFSILKSPPLAGRTFLPEDDVPNSALVAVLSEKLWRRRFAGSRDAIGKGMVIDGNPATIIGVMPDSFRFPHAETELWTNLRLKPPTRRGPFFMKGLGRLRPGVTWEQAQAEMNAIGIDIEQANPRAYSRLDMPIAPLREAMVGRVRPALNVLFGAVVFVLLIAAVNVANLLLARAGAREQEMAVRLSLGAGRLRLLRQLLTESVLLAAMGGIGGVALAAWGIAALRAWNPGELPRIQDVHLDLGVLAFTALISLAAGLLAGLAPALEATRSNLNASLKEGGRGGTAGGARRRTLAVLVTAETALSLVLLTGAGLMVKSFLLLQRVDSGFSAPPENILTMRISPDGKRYSEAKAIAAFYQRVLDRVRTVPSVEIAAIASSLPPDRSTDDDTFVIEGQQLREGDQNPSVPDLTATPDYFRALGVPLRQGRWFTRADTRESPLVTIISESMARRFFPDRNPLGRRLKASGPELTQIPFMEIVGVVGDLKYQGLDRTMPEAYYIPFDQDPFPGPRQFLMVRTAGSAAALAEPVRSAVLEIEREAVITDAVTMAQATGDSVAQPRFRTALVGSFAVVALLLAAVGIYGVIAYSVSQRTHEIGVRMALGAGRGDILGMVMRESALLAAVGIAIGIAGSLAITRLLADFLFTVKPTDPLTFAAVAVLLAGVSLAAGLLPARRATKIDPLAALRWE